MASGIRAAGGVLWRPGRSGIEVCLVHRPRYGDWSLPKGKLEPGEHPLRAALREVAEETDVRAVPQARLPSVRYRSQDRPKVVGYWSMRAVATGGFQPDTEVDEVRWLAVDKAVRLASYPHDTAVVRAFAALPPVTATVMLVRHADTGGRSSWAGSQSGRPLSVAGWAQARQLAPLVAVVAPVRLLAASARRCVQTLSPVADLLDLPIAVTGDLDGPRAGQSPDECALAAAARLAAFGTAGTSAVVCSQGSTVSGALGRLSGRCADFTTAHGGGWLLAFSGAALLTPDPL
ncbi:bifunctional NUDIX hydrolase/histidine phosphatase family protein [Salinispora cortesiana]|uniref:bifunctional NUDIX hydrolase/histidine phosphatase family protein n=1 Tax=Salinispora cortesiana TaxID=1305843 RepID=UPI00042A032F|nr:NUDIX hydrolase [Salinispora cortesiana]